MAKIYLDGIGAPGWVGARYGDGQGGLAAAVAAAPAGVAGGLTANAANTAPASVAQRVALGMARSRTLTAPVSRRLRFE